MYIYTVYNLLQVSPETYGGDSHAHLSAYWSVSGVDQSELALIVLSLPLYVLISYLLLFLSRQMGSKIRTASTPIVQVFSLRLAQP
jgi:hypothetical protein